MQDKQCVAEEHLNLFFSFCTMAEEAYTSENWIVRIYAVKGDDILGRDHKIAHAFSEGKKRKRSKPILRRKAIASA